MAVAPHTTPETLADHPRYRILGELGAGGMGVVYKAEDQLMERVVALKVVAPHLTARRSAVDRFLKEVRAAAKLNHQNIVTAYDTGEAGEYHFLVMEYVEGTSLDRYVAKRGPLTVSAAAQCARQAAIGLQHAHERGMVHRDIKPQNLMITRKGQVKIMDFGLARLAQAEEDETPAPRGQLGGVRTVADGLTNPNVVMGTPDYLSPEQAKNSHDVDIRSDIYSLGCTLYFLLTGSPPFAYAGTVMDKFLAHTHDEPTPIRELRPEVPEGLAAVLARMMAKNPDERYATPSEAAAALVPFTRADANVDPKAACEVVDAIVIGPPSGTLPVPGVRPPFGGASRAAAHESDTPGIGREPTDFRARRPRKSKRSKKRVPWWKQKWAAIAGAALLAFLLVAAITRAGKNRPDPPPTDDTPSAPAASITPTPKINPWMNGGGKSVQGLKVLFVLPSNGVWLADYTATRDRFVEASVDVVTASTDGGQSRPFLHPDNTGEPVKIDLRFTAPFDATPYAALVFIGASAEEYSVLSRGAPVTRAVIKQMLEARKPVAAICLGQMALVGNDLLRRRRAATCEVLFQKMPFLSRGPKSGIIWEDRPVVVDDKLITAGSAKDATAFADAILKAITPE